MDYQGFLDSIRLGTIFGWAHNRSDPNSSVVVQVVINGDVAGFSLANQYRQDLEAAGIGKGCHGFQFAIPDRIRHIESVEAYVANTSYRLPLSSPDAFRSSQSLQELPASQTVPMPQSDAGLSKIASEPDSNVGKWDQWYENLDPQAMGAFRYADTVTYRMAAAFLVDIDELEDWGCGAGGFKRFYRGKYIGLDGSRTPFADRTVDLSNYHSNVDGILLRHVLEHNYQWERILDAAVHSFNRKLCLILFTPFSDVTKEIAHNRQHGVNVPDLSFCRRDIESKFSGLHWELVENIVTPSGYGIEHIYFVWKASAHPATTVPEPPSAAHSGLASLPRLFRTPRPRQPRRALYTAIFGNYDRLKDVAKQPGVDLICFTDDATLQHPAWQVRYAQPKYAHPRLSAKYFKALSHVVLSEYDEVLWIDGSFTVQDPAFAPDAFQYLENAGMALFLHPDRGCIYDEAEISQQMIKYRDQNITGQVACYRKEGFPAQAGLFAGGIIARRNDDVQIRRFNEAWMEQNEKWTYQDQISLPYVLWKLGIEPAVFRQYLWRSRWGVWESHLHDR
jgi:Protein of unknown function (DUF616)